MNTALFISPFTNLTMKFIHSVTVVPAVAMIAIFIYK